jgi:hypothetical protein
LVTLLAPATHASIVAFNNLGSGYLGGGDFAGTFQGDTVTCATNFIPTQSGYISDIWMGAILTVGQTNTLTLLLRADNADMLGATLWQQTFQNGLGTTYGDVFHAGAGSLQIQNAPCLETGTRYWLQAEAPVVEGLAISWYTNAAGDTGSTAVEYSDDGYWQVFDDAPRLSLEVALVPLPAAGWAGLGLLVGMAGVAGLRRTSRRREVA